VDQLVLVLRACHIRVNGRGVFDFLAPSCIPWVVFCVSFVGVARSGEARGIANGRGGDLGNPAQTSTGLRGLPMVDEAPELLYLRPLFFVIHRHCEPLLDFVCVPQMYGKNLACLSCTFKSAMSWSLSFDVRSSRLAVVG
jgi:hypothetical protein